MGDFCKGRKNKEAYRVFYKRFVPAIVGPDLYRQRVQDNDKDEPCTASDEAFALVLLENSYDRWVDIYDKNGCIPMQRRGDRSKRFDSDIAPKYTRGGLKFSEDKETHKAKGWTNEGIERFNVLYNCVRRDRQKRPAFIKRLNKAQARDPKMKASRPKVQAIQAANSLWDETKRPPAVNDDGSSSEDDDSSTDTSKQGY